MITALRKRVKAQGDWTLLGLGATLVVLIVYFSIASPYFLATRNFVNIGQAMAIRGLIAIALTVLLISGGIDLSIAAMAACVGMVAASLIMEGMNGTLAGLIALVAAIGLGGINAFIVIKLRITPLIATLGTLLLFRGMAYVVSGGDNLAIGVNTWSWLGRGRLFGNNLPISLVVFLGILILTMFFMRRTVTGQHLYAIGGNPVACRNTGVKVDRLRASAYMFTGLLAGFAGLALMSQGGVAQPQALFGAELDIITAVLLGGVALTGGRGSLLGTLMGLLIIAIINNGFILLGLQVYWQQVVRGVILITAVALDSFRRGGGYR